jgi:putative FmdB family regulatory protein
MPIYEYACDGCGHEFETLQKMSEAPLTDCPSCNAPKLRRLISAAGFQLKGTGWYATDFKGNRKKPEKGEKAPEPKGEGGASGGAGACPAGTT